jgi:hypothetical protein
MNILTVSKRGTLKLPKEVMGAFHGAKHLLIRVTSSGISLTPVQIQAAADLKNIPEHKPAAVAAKR